MTPAEFVAKYSQIQQKEIAVSQSHFNDLCALAGYPDPLTAVSVATMAIIDEMPEE